MFTKQRIQELIFILLPFLLIAFIIYHKINENQLKSSEKIIKNINLTFDEYRRIPSDKITYTLEKTYTLPLQNPTSFIISQNQIIVAENKKISMFSLETGKTVQTIKTPEQNVAITISPTGNILFASEKKVYQLEQNSVKEYLSLSNTSTVISDIAFTPPFLYIADVKQKLLLCYKNKHIQFVSNGKVPNEKRGFYLPTPHFQLAIGKNNSVWVNNPGKLRLENYDTQGHLIKKWGRAGIQLERFAGCCNPVNFTITKNGDFITYEKGVVRLKRYNKNGHFIDAVTGIKYINGSVKKLPIKTYNNRVFILLTAKNKILIFKKRDEK